MNRLQWWLIVRWLPKVIGVFEGRINDVVLDSVAKIKASELRARNAEWRFEQQKAEHKRVFEALAEKLGNLIEVRKYRPTYMNGQRYRLQVDLTEELMRLPGGDRDQMEVLGEMAAHHVRREVARCRFVETKP